MVALAGLVALAMVLRPGARDTEEISYGDPSAWMVSRASGEIVRVNGAAGDVATRVSVGDPGARLDLVPVGADVAVIDRDSGAVTVVDGIGLEPVDTVTVEDVADASLVSNGQVAYLVTRDSVREIVADPLGLAEVVEVDTRLSGPVVGADGTLWAMTPDGTVRAYLAGSEQRSLDVGVDPDEARLAASGDRTLLVDLATPELRAVGGSAEAPDGCEAVLPAGAPVVGSSPTTSQQPYVAMADADTGRVVVWDVERRACRAIDVSPPGSDLGPPVVMGTTGYVPDYSDGAVVIVDVADGSERARVSVGRADRSFELFERNDEVWFNNPFGSAAALLDRDGIVRVIDKLGEGAGDAAVGEPDGGGGPTTGGDGDAGGIGAAPAQGEGGTAGSGGSGIGGGEGSGEGEAGSGGSDPGADDATAPSSSVPPDNQDPDVESDLIANFTFSASTVRVGEPVEFVDASLGGPTSWSWTFGDGTALNGPQVTKSWDDEGTFTVTLTVDRDDGATDSTSIDILVLGENENVPPVADFGFSSQVVAVGETVSFTDRSSGSPDSWNWTFGDGATATGSSVTHRYTSPGRYTVGLTVANSEGSSFAEAVIQVAASIEPPVAQILASTLNPGVGQIVSFQSRSSGSPTSLSWNFGDGTSASGPNVGHGYGSVGTYTVTLTASNSAGSDTTTVNVVVRSAVDPPVARFTVSDSDVQAGQTVVFTSTSLNEPTGLDWSFGDGGSASGTTVSHAFDRAGTFVVTLTASNSRGSSTAQATINVTAAGLAPDASFTVSSTSVTVGELVQFSDTSANGPTSWNWDFGDGSSSSAANPAHSFSVPGTYTVTLTATNSAGSDQAETVVTVAPPLPNAAFSVSASPVRIGETVSFTDLSTGSPTSWSWDFGDGTTSSEQNPQHAYSRADRFVVSLTVSNAAGATTAQRTIDVNPPPPVAGFTFTPATGATTADPVQFTDTSTNSPATWQWEFGDGSVSSAQNPSHQYAVAGTYTVRLTVTNVSGSDTATATVTIARAVIPPLASFTVAPARTVPVGTTVTFTDTSTNRPDRWTWSMPDGSMPTSQNASFTFSSAGTFTVSLTVANSAGSNSASTTITVLPPPPVASFTQSVAGDGVTVSFVDTSSNGPTSWLWSFGDGTSSAARNPVHTYGAGTFTVTLVAANAGGSSAPFSRTITIVPPPPRPVASFTFSTSDLTASFVDTSSGPITNWSWNFGDGTTATSPNPVHTYASGGTFTVTLTVLGPGGSSSVSAAVTVTAPPPPPPPPPPPTTVAPAGPA
ncbi:MAG: PKD domain-containing protein [Acidimicrobiia bacterium]|nr:PKD domain-containing protein [Acidimicrobiia bacterium]